MAGYSGTPLPRKLGIKAGHLVTLLRAPDDFETTLGELPEGATLRRGLRGKQAIDVAILFVDRSRDLERELPRVAARLQENGGLWIAWPKQASGLPTDLNGAAVRTAGQSIGLVDNKVCAIDDTWSGHRFVNRLVDRK